MAHNPQSTTIIIKYNSTFNVNNVNELIENERASWKTKRKRKSIFIHCIRLFFWLLPQKDTRPLCIRLCLCLLNSRTIIIPISNYENLWRRKPEKKAKEIIWTFCMCSFSQFCTHFVFGLNARIRKEIMKEADKDEKKDDLPN